MNWREKFWPSTNINRVDVAQLRLSALQTTQGRAVIFIHGLGSDPTGTWGSMLRTLRSDVQMNDFIFDVYTYPTAVLKLLPVNPLPRIQHLARGLATEIRLRHNERTSWTFVCHSLGGLIARQYIINELNAGRGLGISRVLFLSTPHNGASIASIANQMGISNTQTQQLAQNSDILERLNDEWEGLKAEKYVTASYVWAAQDQVVDEKSAKGDHRNFVDDILVGYNHRRCPLDLIQFKVRSGPKRGPENEAQSI